MRVLLGDLLADGEEARGNVPKGTELGLDAAEHVFFNHGEEAGMAAEHVGLEGDGARLAVLAEEGRGFADLVLVPGLEVGERDDGLVFGVPFRQQAEDLPVEAFARLEEPF